MGWCAQEQWMLSIMPAWAWFVGTLVFAASMLAVLRWQARQADRDLRKMLDDIRRSE